jgi:hypothetical protein
MASEVRDSVPHPDRARSEKREVRSKKRVRLSLPLTFNFSLLTSFAFACFAKFAVIVE